MRIIRLEAENVKRLQAVEVIPDGDTVVIGGRNAQGKSSLLDSISYALGGKKLIPDQPIREGQDKARVQVELDELTVVRSFTKSGGGSLTVSNKDGAKFGSPQAVLDKLTGSLTLDPLKFIHLDPSKQRDTLKGLVGLDFSEQDRQRKDLYDQRTMINRDFKKAEAQLEQLPPSDDTLTEVSVSDLMQELEQVREHNRQIQGKRDQAQQLAGRIEKGHAYIEDLKRKLEEAERGLTQLQGQKQQLEDELADIEEQDEQTLVDLISQSEETNRRVAQNKQRQETEQSLKTLQEEAQKLTGQIQQIDEQKSQALAQAQFPVEGLFFNEDAILLNGLPFNQASQAEQLRVSVGMAFALNPKLKVLLIRDGSLLDEDSLKLVADLAAEHGGQVWIERVGEGQECQVVIEDGRIK